MKQPALLSDRTLPTWIRGLAILLMAIGTFLVAIISGPDQGIQGFSLLGFLGRDLIYVAAALGALWFGRRVSRQFLARTLPLVTLLVFILVLAVLVPHVGTSINGARRWFVMGPLQFQPSELLKLVVCLGLPLTLVDGRFGFFRRVHPVVAWLVALGGAGLVVLEPDMGTGAIIVFISLAIVWVWGMERRWLQIMGIISVAGAGLSFAISPYQFWRLADIYIKSRCNPLDNCYQTNQSKIALGSGGIIGPGPGHIRSAWGFLPNANTDFIFSVVGEAFGYVGTAAIILLYIALVFCAVRASIGARDEASKYIALGIATWFAMETAVNVASCLGLFAVTGIPLPLMSYGGTALVVNMAAIGILVNIAEHKGISTISMAKSLKPRKGRS